MAALTETKSTAISSAAIREVVADVVGLNDAAVGAVDDAIEDVLVGFDEVAALMERVTERRIELSRTTLARVEALSAALPAALQAVSVAEECVATASTSLDGYAARLAHLEAAWAARTGEKPAQAGASAVLSGLFGFRRSGAAAPPAAAAPALVERPPPPQAWDAASCRLPTSSLVSKLGRAGLRAKQGLAEADAIGDGDETTHEEEGGTGGEAGAGVPDSADGGNAGATDGAGDAGAATGAATVAGDDTGDAGGEAVDAEETAATDKAATAVDDADADAAAEEDDEACDGKQEAEAAAEDADEEGEEGA